MERTVKLFLSLLIALVIAITLHPRLMALFEAAMVLNTVTCGWYLYNAFFPPVTPRPRSPVISNAIIVLLLLFNALVFMGTYRQLQLMRHTDTRLDASAPAVQWTAFDGSRHTLAEFAGRPVVLHFWGTWCSPCRKEFPQFVLFTARHPDVTFLAIDANDDPGAADRYVAQLGQAAGKATPPNLHYARDPDNAISGDLFKIPGFPTTILIDAKGRMRRKFTEPLAWEDDAVAGYMEQLKAY